MTPSTKTNERQIGEWVLQTRQPEGQGPFQLILLLHGWTGDERSMLIFSSRLPKNALLVSPRALYSAPLSGYSWYPDRSKIWPWVDDFRPASEALLDLLIPENFPQADVDRLHLVGFSQGAALTYTFAMLHPERVISLAGLSGFVPDGASALISARPLKGKRVFVSHGTEDELVPVERAREGVELLERAGGDVVYCEDEVGHKLSATCFQSLQDFFRIGIS